MGALGTPAPTHTRAGGTRPDRSDRPQPGPRAQQVEAHSPLPPRPPTARSRGGGPRAQPPARLARPPSGFRSPVRERPGRASAGGGRERPPPSPSTPPVPRPRPRRSPGGGPPRPPRCPPPPVAAGEWGQVRPPNPSSLRLRRRRRPSVRCLLNFSVWLFGL